MIFFQAEFYSNEDAFLLTANVAMLPEHCVTFLKCSKQEDGLHTRFVKRLVSIDYVYLRYSDTGVCNTVNIAN